MPNPTVQIYAFDDNKNDLNLLGKHLQGISGWDVQFHGFGEFRKALTTPPDHSPDLVFLNYRVGAQSGLEVLLEIQQTGYQGPIILLTGKHDKYTATEAIMAGAADCIPKDPQLLHRAALHAFENHRLFNTPHSTGETKEQSARELFYRIRIEKEILEQTQGGAIEAMTQVLSLVYPEVFSRSVRIKRYATIMAKQMGLPGIWKLEIAALLSQVGWVTLPHEVVFKVFRGKPLAPHEATLYAQYPQIGADLIMKIPGMEDIASIIAFQEHELEYPLSPDDQSQEPTIPIESRILKVALDFDALETSGRTKLQALTELKTHRYRYNPDVFKALSAVCSTTPHFKKLQVSLADLGPPMILAQDVRTKSGALVVPKGQIVTFMLLTRLQNFTIFQSIIEPITVLTPLQTLQEELEELQIQA